MKSSNEVLEKPALQENANGLLLFSKIAECFTKVEATTKRLEITALMKDLFDSVKDRDKKEDLVNILQLCTGNNDLTWLGVGESLLVKAIQTSTGNTRKQIMAQLKKEGDLGSVAKKCSKQQTKLSFFGASAPERTQLPVAFLRSSLKNLGEVGEQTRKVNIISKLLSQCEDGTDEVKYLVRILQGQLRIGLAESTVLVALGESFDVEELTVRDAFSQLPIYKNLVEALFLSEEKEDLDKKNEIVLEHCAIRPLVPVKPMLAKPTKGFEEIYARLKGQRVSCEFKYDGERAQVHYTKEKQKIYSRNCEDQTLKYPDVLEYLKNIFSSSGIEDFIVDCEVVAFDPIEKKILPFQILATRARKDVTKDDVKVQVLIVLFDLLYLNGKSLLKKSLGERKEILEEAFQPLLNEGDIRMRFVEAKDFDLPESDGAGLSLDVEDAQSKKDHLESLKQQILQFMNLSIEGFCEGLMIKTHADSYQPSKRSVNWLKLKKDYVDLSNVSSKPSTGTSSIGDSLDLVPIGAFYGKGKRAGVYGAFLVACYDEDTEQFQAITKIGTGFSDVQLSEFKEKFTAFVTDEKPADYIIGQNTEVNNKFEWFRIDHGIVWEVKCADMSLSPKYMGAVGLISESKGIGLRFPRFLRVREDKTPADATNSEQIVDMYKSQALS
eukprot:snap_masked-scaffold_6-processed-gene-19.21-mRNA-1 protein AED:0.00 eAED:0.01 QI:0/-1/0/1/-1/1/1/0/664